MICLTHERIDSAVFFVFKSHRHEFEANCINFPLLADVQQTNGQAEIAGACREALVSRQMTNQPQRLYSIMKSILLSNLFATLFMTGLIWFVQIVHYPLFADVGREQFSAYEFRHQRLTTWVVAPVMLIELVTTVLLIKQLPAEFVRNAWIGLGLVMACWVVTAIWSVPTHRKLEGGFDAAAINWLINTNWIRTVAWTARSLLMSFVVWKLLDGASATRS